MNLFDIFKKRYPEEEISVDGTCGNTYSSKDYMNNIYVNPAFMLPQQKKCSALQAIEWGVFKKKSVKGRKTKEEVEGHELYPLFKMVNENLSFAEFLKLATTWYDADDNGFLIERYKDSVGGIPKLKIYNPNNFTITFLGGEIYKIEITNPKRIVTNKLDIQKFMWIKQVSPYDDIGGAALDNQAGRGFSIQNAMAVFGDYVKNSWKWNNSLVKNSGKPGSLFNFKKPLPEREAEKLKEKLQADNTLSDKGKDIFISGEMEYKQLSINPTDSDWMTGESKGQSRVSISTGTPVELIGEGQSTYNNRREAKAELYEDTVLPWAYLLAERLTYFFRDMLKDGEFIGVKTNEIPVLQKNVGEVIKSLDSIKNRVTINEYRYILSEMADLNLEKIENGDIILVSSSDVDLEELTQEEQPPREDETDVEEQ